MAPAQGARIKVLWPGGKYDFLMEFLRFDTDMPVGEQKEFVWVVGRVIEPVDQAGWTRRFFAKPTGRVREYSLLPREG